MERRKVDAVGVICASSFVNFTASLLLFCVSLCVLVCVCVCVSH